MLEIFDNKIKDIDKIYKELKKLPYYYGEVDDINYEPTGLTSELSEDSFTYKSIKSFIFENEVLRNKTILRSYVNLFLPREQPNYHTDGDVGTTLLYYANLYYDINEGGETKFVTENNTLTSVLPLPGRIVIFPAVLQHTASSFKNKHRFTVAFKFKENI